MSSARFFETHAEVVRLLGTLDDPDSARAILKDVSALFRKVSARNPNGKTSEEERKRKDRERKRKVSARNPNGNGAESSGNGAENADAPSPSLDSPSPLPSPDLSHSQQIREVDVTDGAPAPAPLPRMAPPGGARSFELVEQFVSGLCAAGVTYAPPARGERDVLAEALGVHTAKDSPPGPKAFELGKRYAAYSGSSPGNGYKIRDWLNAGALAAQPVLGLRRVPLEGIPSPYATPPSAAEFRKKYPIGDEVLTAEEREARR